jgi:hypothetical protein
MKGLDGEIDRLYQLPLSQFTAERNALAKRAGADAARIRALEKPSVPAWAVNQLYWRDRGEWDALVASAENLRHAHRAVLAGREGDVRAAGQVHDQAVESALRATVIILEELKHPVTDATRQGILNTLRALPAEDAQPGRLTGALQPGGFEMLAGLAIGGGRSAGTSRPAHATAPRSREPAHPHETRRKHTTRDQPAAPARQAAARAVAAARQEAASADRALREAEQSVRREEFEAARASREERRASEAVDKARDAFDRAKQDLERAEAAHKEARDARRAADARVPKAHDAATAAEKRSKAAAAALEKLTAHG